MRSKFFILLIVLVFTNIISAQRPPRGNDGFPEWAKIVDVNRNGRIEQEEHRIAADNFFKKHDRNGNGILEEDEMPPKPSPDRPPPPRNAPPFLFLERGEFDLTREQFDEKVNLRFIVFDADGDLAIDGEEIRAVRPPDRREPPNMAMAQFIGGEMRFGDKIVENAPFSAETVREESKRLFDGSLVKSESRGLIFRDGEGRIRQEMPLEKIGGFPVVGTDKQPIRLVQILDLVSGDSFSLNPQTKTYFKIPYLQKPPLEEKKSGDYEKVENIGSQTLEGIFVKGTKTTIEVSAGEIGNDKPILVVTERWFSPELQTVVFSKHTDPFIGEVIFRLTNIKVGEPSPALFKVPLDYAFFDVRKNRERVNESNRRNRKND